VEKQKHIVEITYSDTGKKEVETFHTDDLAWTMTQYKRNRQHLTWEEVDCCGEDCCDHNQIEIPFEK
jgi:hypothetical protein|tara:strand:- start:1528 stop:1728 length:201 start_codon:yes stop_codon:yes gene_type:complete